MEKRKSILLAVLKEKKKKWSLGIGSIVGLQGRAGCIAKGFLLRR